MGGDRGGGRSFQRQILIRYPGDAAARVLFAGAVGLMGNSWRDVHVASLRQKLEPTPSHPRYIITVHRRGYRFDG